MKNQKGLVIGLLLGAGIMFLFDPDRGRRRRALLRDRVVHRTHGLEEMGSGIGSKARHLRNRARGAIIVAKSHLRREEVDDDVLEGRVRSQLPRLIDDAADIYVTAEHGRVTLRGVASEARATALVDAVQEIPGVHDVINRLKSPRGAR